MTKICNIEPKRIIVPENGSSLIYIKPCGVRYTDRHEVHCKKFEERTCEYMAQKFIESQVLE